MGKISKTLVFAVLTLSILSVLVRADNYGKSTVYVNVPYDTSFTLTVLGCGGTSIISSTEVGATPTTGDISFNATVIPSNNINAQSVGTCAQVQTGSANPVYRYKPTGNIPLNFSLKFETAPPGWITIWAVGVADGTGCSGAGGVNTGPLGSAYKTVAYNIGQNNCYANVTIFADVTALASPGITNLGSLYSRSQRA